MTRTRDGSKTQELLPQRRKDILQTMQILGGKGSAVQIADRSGYDEHEARLLLQDLEQSAAVERVRTTHGYQWQVRS